MTTIDLTQPASEEAVEPVQPVSNKRVERLLLGILLLLAGGTLYFGRDLLLPIALAFMASFVLRPVVRSLRKRGIPDVLGSLLLVIAVFAIGAALIFVLSGPVAGWVSRAPEVAQKVQERLVVLRRPIDTLMRAADRVEQITNGQEDPRVQRVVVNQPGLLARAASGASNIAAQTGLMLVLLFFLLASGDLFYEKVVRVLPTLHDKKLAVRIIRDIEHDVSRYVLTIALINAGLGVAVGLGLYALGMPTPIVWGALVALLNFIPYIGGLAGMFTVAVVALVSFDSVGYALLAPAIYATLNFIEGNFVTPYLVSRRLQLNEVAVLLALTFWGFLWGIAGLLFAVPFLVLMKVLGDHLESFGPFSEFLSARISLSDERTAAEAAAPD